jgi:hypothetical protein
MTEVSLTNLRSKINNNNNKNKSKATTENISLKILFACRVPLGPLLTIVIPLNFGGITLFIAVMKRYTETNDPEKVSR